MRARKSCLPPAKKKVKDGAVPLNVCNFNCSFFTQNLDTNRSETVNLFNIRFDKSVPIQGRYKASIMLDIYNLLNSDPVTNFKRSTKLYVVAMSFNIVGDGLRDALDPKLRK